MTYHLELTRNDADVVHHAITECLEKIQKLPFDAANSTAWAPTIASCRAILSRIDEQRRAEEAASFALFLRATRTTTEQA